MYNLKTISSTRTLYNLHPFYKKNDADDVHYRVWQDHDGHKAGKPGTGIIRAYKAHNVSTSDSRCFGVGHVPLPLECIFIVIMDEDMVEQARRNTKLKQIDATHNVTAYENTKLISMMSHNEETGEGEHEAWLITNIEDEVIYTAFYSVVKREAERVSTTHVVQLY